MAVTKLRLTFKNSRDGSKALLHFEDNEEDERPCVVVTKLRSTFDSRSGSKAARPHFDGNNRRGGDWRGLLSKIKIVDATRVEIATVV